MRAIVATSLGGPGVLQEQSIPLRWPRGRHDVLVRLLAAALNPADVWFRKLGGYIESEQPLILGHDGAGIVEAIGPAVSSIKAGDRVCFCNGGIGGETGTYAEFSVVPESQLVRIPDGIDILSAAALPLVAITMWESLFERARLEPREAVLIHGGAGGTGHIGVQLAKLHGARVAATVSNQAKADLVEKLGADCPILYRSEDFVSTARIWSEGGLDVAIDNVGGEVMQRTFAAMATYGRIVTLMSTPSDDLSTAYNSNLCIHNVMMLTPMWRQLNARLHQQALYVERVMKLLQTGKLSVVIDRVFPLSAASAAHMYLESGKAMGKLVLEI
jgi:NADPH2:quinone reductase